MVVVCKIEIKGLYRIHKDDNLNACTNLEESISEGTIFTHRDVVIFDETFLEVQ